MEKTQKDMAVYRLRAGDRLRQRYVVRRVLGEGGFGITYQGYDEVLATEVAIKEYYPEGLVHRDVNSQGDSNVYMYEGIDRAAYEKGMRNFLTEARILAGFEQMDGIVSVRDFFEENQTAYIIMEYLDGMSVKQYVRNYGPIPYAEVLQKMNRILVALHGLHQHHMIHRDVSSDNIMMMPDGELKLIDFGAARRLQDADQTQTMTVMFKRGYAAEEQYRARGKQGPWTDVYGLCATMYFMMSGKRPDESVERAVQDKVEPLVHCKAQDIPEQISHVIEAGMSVRAENRTQGIPELYRGLYGVEMPETRRASDVFFRDDHERSDREEEQDNGNGEAKTGSEQNGEAGQEPNLTFTSLKHQLHSEIRETVSEHRTIQVKRKGKVLAEILFGCLILGLLWMGADWIRQRNQTSGHGAAVPVTTSQPVEKSGEEPQTSQEPSPEPTETPSATPEVYYVPNLKNLTEKQARKKLKRNGQPKVIITYVYNDHIQKGRVIRQSPAKGTEIVKGLVVRMKVSKGVKPVVTAPPKSTPTIKPGAGQKDGVDGTLDGMF